MIGLRGQKIDEDALDDGMWLRANGKVMDDPRRIEMSRVQVIAPDDKEHRRTLGFDGLKPGANVTVEGRTIRF